MNNTLKIILDIIWRLTIIMVPVIGFTCEQKYGVGAFTGGFVAAWLIGIYGRNYGKIFNK